MAAFLVDNFTEASDTALLSHTPDTGSTWHVMFGTSGGLTVVGAEDRVTGDSAITNGYYRNAATPPGADYYVEATVRWTVVNDVSQLPGILIRASGGSEWTHYYCRYLGNATVGVRAWQLRKIVAGTDTNLGSYTQDLPVDTDYVIRLVASGTSLKLYVDGVERISVTDSAISAAGFAGVLSRSNGRVDSLTADTAGGQTVAVGIASESDSAHAVGHAKAVGVGLASETDTAPAATAVRAYTVGIASETDSALDPSHAKAVAVGLASETDTAPAVTGAKAKAVGIAVETDSALNVSIPSGGLVGIAATIDTALPITIVKTRAVGLATEADSAFAAAVAKTLQLGLATEADSALAVGHAKAMGVGIAAESDSALPVTVAGGVASESPGTAIASSRGASAIVSSRGASATAGSRP